MLSADDILEMAKTAFERERGNLKQSLNSLEVGDHEKIGEFLNFHLIVESEMMSFIQVACPEIDWRINPLRNFAPKLNVLKAIKEFGPSVHIIEGFAAINQIRNKFAHEMHAREIPRESVNAIRNALTGLGATVKPDDLDGFELIKIFVLMSCTILLLQKIILELLQRIRKHEINNYAAQYKDVFEAVAKQLVTKAKG